MIAASTILAPLLLACVVLYIRFQPNTTGNKNTQNRFNLFVAALAILASIAAFIYFWQTTGQSVDRAWWPVLALFASMFLISFILVIGILIRFATFRKDN